MSYIWTRPQSMGAYNAMMENVDRMTDEVFERAEKLAEAEDSDITRDHVEKALQQIEDEAALVSDRCEGLEDLFRF